MCQPAHFFTFKLRKHINDWFSDSLKGLSHLAFSNLELAKTGLGLGTGSNFKVTQNLQPGFHVLLALDHLVGGKAC
jgi:hypothetical protein